MVTEMPHHSALRCVSRIRQNNAKPLFSYGLRVIVTCLLTAALGVLFHAARHSFATIARNECDVPMEDIALCLTHRSGFDMTDTYVRPDFSRVDRVVRRVLDYVFHPDAE